MIGVKTQYAVIIIHEIKDPAIPKPIKLKDIAVKYSLSLDLLEQVARNLRIKDYLKSVRGPGGGYIIGERMEFVNLYDVIAAVDKNKTRVKSVTPLVLDIQNQVTEKLSDIVIK